MTRASPLVQGASNLEQIVKAMKSMGQEKLLPQVI